jgi:ABC-type transport system involved in cytochrome c biogenesis permease subunit
MTRKPAWWLAPVLLACLLAAPASAAVESLREWERIPVLSNGRVMPMDSFARNTLLQFSGRRELGRKPAVPASAWLARTLFQPDDPGDEPLFLINHPEVAQALGIEPEEKRRYTFGQLHSGLAKLQELARDAARMEDEARSPVEREILRVSGNISQYLQLLSSLRFALPHPELAVRDPGLRERMGLGSEPGPLSFLDVASRIDVLQDAVANLQSVPAESWTAEQQEAFRISSVLFGLSRQNQGSFFTPVAADPHGDAMWLSGWDALSLQLRDPELTRALENLGAMAAAYQDGRQVEFDMAARAYRAFCEARIPEPGVASHVGLEVRFNRWNLFSRAAWCYGFAFFLAFAGFVSERRGPRLAAAALLLPAVAMHAAGIAMRMVIMGRPPVTNLHATFLFVGLVCVALSLILEAMQRSGLGLTAAGFSGLAMLMVAQKFFSDGDTMHKVVAVLDSNFWLSTHVVAITTGYAGCVVAGVLGHVYLVQRLATPDRREALAGAFRAMMGMLAFGLVFSFLGTMLGGVWADQSWGRFWGWDPKENGALLIVLWCAMLYHARLAGWIAERGMAAGCVLGINVVLLAWLGVNLLSVGLHSYGFTSGLATGLFSTMTVEIAFVAITVPWIGARERVRPVER